MNLVIFLVLTIVIYQLCVFVQRKSGWLWLNPMLLSIVIIIPMLLLFNVSYSTYMEGGKWLNALLEPAVVALGFPLFQQLKALKNQWKTLLIVLLIGVLVALLSSLTASLLLSQPDALAVSMALKSITTPIALELTTMMNGIGAITALVIIGAGLIGAVWGISILKFLGVHCEKSQGLAIGAGSHVLGTATVSKQSYELGAYGALSLIVSALITSFIAPILIPVFLFN